MFRFFFVFYNKSCNFAPKITKLIDILSNENKLLIKTLYANDFAIPYYGYAIPECSPEDS